MNAAKEAVDNAFDLEQAKALLQMLEFTFNFRRCSICAGWMVGPYGETDYAHTKDCPLGNFLDKHCPDRPKQTYPKKGIKDV